MFTWLVDLFDKDGIPAGRFLHQGGPANTAVAVFTAMHQANAWPVVQEKGKLDAPAAKVKIVYALVNGPDWVQLVIL